MPAIYLHVQMSLRFAEVAWHQPSNPTPIPINRYNVLFTPNDIIRWYNKLLAFLVACKSGLTHKLLEFVVNFPSQTNAKCLFCDVPYLMDVRKDMYLDAMQRLRRENTHRVYRSYH